MGNRMTKEIRLQQDKIRGYTNTTSICTNSIIIIILIRLVKRRVMQSILQLICAGLVLACLFSLFYGKVGVAMFHQLGVNWVFNLSQDCAVQEKSWALHSKLFPRKQAGTPINCIAISYLSFEIHDRNHSVLPLDLYYYLLLFL